MKFLWNSSEDLCRFSFFLINQECKTNIKTTCWKIRIIILPYYKIGHIFIFEFVFNISTWHFKSLFYSRRKLKLISLRFINNGIRTNSLKVRLNYIEFFSLWNVSKTFPRKVHPDRLNLNTILNNQNIKNLTRSST